MLLLAGLSTGHKVGLAVVAILFIGFALASSFLAPKRWPDFPGKNGLSVFVLACFALFFAQMASVYFFGKESEARASGAAAASGRTIKVTESEYKIVLSSKTATRGSVTFLVHNAGKIPHDVVVTGPRTTKATKTPLIKAGGSAKLTVTLAHGTYTLYCNVPGHRQLGMQAKLTVG